MSKQKEKTMVSEHAAGSALTFDDICGQLDSIVEQVRRKDTSLERSLDLFDEAIKLGSAAVEMVDVTELSAAEEEKFASEYCDTKGSLSGSDEGIADVGPGAGEDLRPKTPSSGPFASTAAAK